MRYEVVNISVESDAIKRCHKFILYILFRSNKRNLSKHIYIYSFIYLSMGEDRFLPAAQRGDLHRRPPLRGSFSIYLHVYEGVVYV
jgi:hypothetical protein